MREHLAKLLGLGDPWRRPLPTSWLRHDVIIAAVALLLAMVGLEISRSVGLLQAVGPPAWLQHAALAGTALVLIWRRRAPILVLLVVAAAMFATGVTMPQVMAQLIPQCLYLFAFYNVLAWGAPRTRAVVVTAVTVLFMFGWIGWQFVIGDGAAQARAMPHCGLLGPLLANVLFSLLLNLVFFGGATLVGQISWRAARQQAALADQAATIEAQAHELHEQALLDERLRIARELHDVVAHHVAVMGVQAGAARKVLDRRPDQATTALQQVERSAREAVSQMRALLGTLRRADEKGRTPEPSATDLAGLVRQVTASGFPVTFEAVEDRPGLLDEVPGAVGLSLYRTAQEALANSRRHSSAESASVVLRAITVGGQDFAEVEVLDEGRPRAGTSGGGLGLVGMRERITVHGGEGEIGPRETGGYRVRVRLPLAPTHDAVTADV